MKAIAVPKFSSTSQRMKLLLTRSVGPPAVGIVVVPGPAAAPAVIGRPVAAAMVMRLSSSALRRSFVVIGDSFVCPFRSGGVRIFGSWAVTLQH